MLSNHGTVSEHGAVPAARAEAECPHPAQSDRFDKICLCFTNREARLLSTDHCSLITRHLPITDLSGSLQGAGGVGGLIMAEDLTGTSVLSYFPTYDGNGNITAWVNASGTVVARQRYDAFGNIIQQTGTAPSNYGFSTKPIEKVTGLLYYGYRYYDPITGRWPSRDPIGERGGLNLYGFVGNNGVALIDYLGYLNRIPNPIPENPLPLKPVPVQPAPNPPQPAPNLPQPAPEAVFGIIYQSYTICMEVELIPCKGCDHIFLMPGTMICGFGESFSKPMKIDPLLMGQAIADWIMDEKALQVAREKALDDLFQSPRLKKPGCLQIKQDGEMIQIKNKPNAIWLPPIAPANW